MTVVKHNLTSLHRESTDSLISSVRRLITVPLYRSHYMRIYKAYFNVSWHLANYIRVLSCEAGTIGSTVRSVL